MYNKIYEIIDNIETRNAVLVKLLEESIGYRLKMIEIKIDLLGDLIKTKQGEGK
jgi:hypothetical protein